jgi:F0F1-type ATP synthase membrane subunit c/vacuolar-type H+-ATPase subunit K
MDVEAAAELVTGLKALGAGLAMMGVIGAGAGIGILAGGIAFAEATAIYALVVALIILFVL